MTDWTFIGDGNPDMLRDKPHQINFQKRQKASDLILMIKLHQSTIYNLAKVPQLEAYLDQCLYTPTLGPEAEDQRLYEISLSREPRERDDVSLPIVSSYTQLTRWIAGTSSEATERVRILVEGRKRGHYVQQFNLFFDTMYTRSNCNDCYIATLPIHAQFLGFFLAAPLPIVLLAGLPLFAGGARMGTVSLSLSLSMMRTSGGSFLFVAPRTGIVELAEVDPTGLGASCDIPSTDRFLLAS